MPTLDWIGKKAVVNHHREVPYRLIHCDGELSGGDPAAPNLLIQGDNLEALKALLPYYAGKVKCIYIDPPYNTGNEGWVYNDAVSSPEIRKWLGETVGKEAEDLSRHDKWLCMMYPRIKLLKQFLSHDGIFFASCDDNELENFKAICDQVFGRRNHAATLIWNTEGNTDNQLQIKVNHEYILMYYSDVRFRDFAVGNVIDPNTREDSNLRAGFADNNITKNGVKNPPSVVKLPIDFPCSVPSINLSGERLDDEFFQICSLERMISTETQNRYSISRIPVRLDDMLVADGRLVKTCRLYSGWANANKLAEFIRNGCQPVPDGDDEIRFYLNANGCIRYRKTRKNAKNILSVLRELGTTEKTRTSLRKMGVDFQYPKPVNLIKYLLEIGAENPDSIVLDSFSGSGTTGHAVLQLNKEQQANRSFILIEMDPNVAQSRTQKRLKACSEGYSYSEKNGKSLMVTGLGGGFRYCKLGASLFNEFGDIDSGVTFPDLAAHIFFSETGAPIPLRAKGDCSLIGTYKDKAVYLLFSASEQGVAREAAGNVLTPDLLAQLPPVPDGFVGQRVVYGEGCTVSADRLKTQGVSFKQIPYQIEAN